jgi:hypothetical protein
MPTSSREILRIEAFYHIAIWLVKKNFHVPQFFHTFSPRGERVRVREVLKFEF